MKQIKGQSALEYMLLMGTVMVIVVVGFKVFLPKTQNASDLYFNRVSHGITGNVPSCGDGTCNGPEGGLDGPEDSNNCCVDCPSPELSSSICTTFN